MGREIKIISVSGCPWCRKAVQLARDSGYELNEVKMSWGTELREVQSKHEDWKTVPMVYLVEGEEETFIGGYTDFVKFVRGDDRQKEDKES